MRDFAHNNIFLHNPCQNTVFFPRDGAHGCRYNSETEGPVAEGPVGPMFLKYIQVTTVMRGCFAVLRSNLYIYFIPSNIEVYLVSLDSQKNKLLGNNIYVNVGKQTVK